jgi:YidC/Oxa1 family membrane protein insertase
VDQRRVIIFLLVSLLVVMAFDRLFRPQAPPGQQPPAAQEEAGKEQIAGQGDEGAAEAAPGAVPPIQDLGGPVRYVTLGSLDYASGYRLLATLTTSGAAVRRAELSSPQHTDEHDRSGYLGELELAAADAGVLVQVVGAGTPAALAGIQAGDVIVGLGVGQVVDTPSPADLERLLSRTRPGQQVTLHVRRGDAAPQQLVAKLVRRPFAVVRPEIENYQMRGDEPPPDFVDRPSLLVALAEFNGQPLEGNDFERLATTLENGNWEIAEQSGNSVAFRRALPELNVELVKRYTLRPAPTERLRDVNSPDYHLQLDIEMRNTGPEPQSLAYRLDGPTGMPTEGWWYGHKISQGWGSAGLRDVSVRFEGGGAIQHDCANIAEGEVETMEGRPLLYAGVDGQYFSAILIPQKEAKEAWFATTNAIVVGPKPGERMPPTLTNVTCRLKRQTVLLEPNATRRDSFQVFLGPKRPSLLAQYRAGGEGGASLGGLIYYGWFGGVAQAMLAVLHFFYGIVHNYGIAIVMLTVLVRGAMFPLSYKQNQNMARMQALKPEMDRITEKYKSDMQRRSQEIQALYRKHQINPLGGCLPMLLQLPIFIGLYRALMIDVELRGSSLLGDAIHWCSNLAAPDMLLDWSPVMPAFIDRGYGLFSLGPYLNILPIITVALFLVTQKMTMPPPTNEQAELQQKMMKYMMILMGVFFYKVASGLCLYFIASSLWGIAERKLLKTGKTSSAPATGAEAAAAARPSAARPPKPSRNGGADQKKRRKDRRK